MEVSPTPDWAASPANNGESRPLPSEEMEKMEMSFSAPSNGASELAPSSERTFFHRVFRFFKCITVIVALLLLIAQIVSVVFLPFDVVELVLKIFLSSFSVLIILNELEWWGMLRSSALLWNFIPRGYFYAFIGTVSMEENNIKPTAPLSSLPFDYTAALFIETSSWMMFGIGAIYLALGLCCGQRYLGAVREEHANRLSERKRIFEEGVRHDDDFEA